MRILVTNDDGINAPGLKIAIAIAEEIAGPEGEVWVVAPAFEQSGVGHCISYTRPMMVAQMGPRTFATEGSPADCVIVAIHDVLDGARPDLVISGVNRGNNAGENVLYSGTVGAAMEGALQGLPAIALSQYLGPGTADLDNPFEASARHGAAAVRALLERGIWGEEDYRIFYNVNFPPVAADKVRGLRIARQGYRRDAKMRVVPHVAPNGRRFLWITSGPQQTPTAPGSDVAAALQDYVAITPLRADLTADDAVAALAPLFA